MTASQSNPEPHNGVKFEELLSAMPRIAEAVNVFVSEENQRTALSALLRALGHSDESPSHAESAEPSLSVVRSLDLGQSEEHGAEAAVPTRAVGGPAGGRRRNRKKPSLRALDIDLYPEGKPSLRDFAAQKTPSGHFEMNVAAVYYLQEVLGLEAVEAGHVLTAFNECGWRVPADPVNSLNKTASAKKWLDTSDMRAIRLTFSGRNLVQHDLPKSAKNSA
jgi:hypothetical protein